MVLGSPTTTELSTVVVVVAAVVVVSSVLAQPQAQVATTGISREVEFTMLTTCTARYDCFKEGLMSQKGKQTSRRKRIGANRQTNRDGQGHKQKIDASNSTQINWGRQRHNQIVAKSRRLYMFIYIPGFPPPRIFQDLMLLMYLFCVFYV